jgi:VWFA-related protein
MRFAIDAQMVLSWTSDDDSVLNALGQLATEKPRKATALHDACYQALEEAKKSRFSKRVIILFTDGMDYEPKKGSRERLQRALRESDIMVYAVNVIGRQNFALQMDRRSDATLSKIVTVSGGMQLYADNPEQMGTVFKIIAGLIRSQYVIGFKPAQVAGNDKWHRLKVIVKLPPDAPRALKNLSASHREGHYTVSNEQ